MQAEQNTLSQFAERTRVGTSAEDFQKKGSQLGYTLLGGGNEHDVLLDVQILHGECYLRYMLLKVLSSRIVG